MRPQKTGMNDPDDLSEKSSKEIVRIPADIKPTLEPFRIEIMFWGLRDLKKLYMLPVIKPKIKVEVCGEVLQSETIPDTRKSLNFPEPLKYIDVVGFTSRLCYIKLHVEIAGFTN